MTKFSCQPFNICSGKPANQWMVKQEGRPNQCLELNVSEICRKIHPWLQVYFHYAIPETDDVDLRAQGVISSARTVEEYKSEFNNLGRVLEMENADCSLDPSVKITEVGSAFGGLIPEFVKNVRGLVRPTVIECLPYKEVLPYLRYALKQAMFASLHPKIRDMIDICEFYLNPDFVDLRPCTLTEAIEEDSALIKSSDVVIDLYASGEYPIVEGSVTSKLRLMQLEDDKQLMNTIKASCIALLKDNGHIFRKGGKHALDGVRKQDIELAH